MGGALMGTIVMLCWLMRDKTDLYYFPAAAGGAGLLGGALIADAIGDHQEELREDAYNQGRLNFLLSVLLYEN